MVVQTFIFGAAKFQVFSNVGNTRTFYGGQFGGKIINKKPGLSQRLQTCAQQFAMSRDARYVLGKKQKSPTVNEPTSCQHQQPLTYRTYRRLEREIVGNLRTGLYSVIFCSLFGIPRILIHSQPTYFWAKSTQGSHGGYPNLRPCYRNSCQKLHSI